MTNLQNRQARLRNRLAEIQADGMLVTDLTNVRYLSGFTGSAGTLMLLPDSQHFFSDGRYREQARDQVQDFQIHIGTGDHMEIIRNSGVLNGSATVAFEEDNITVSRYQKLGEIFPGMKWVQASMVVEELAVVKDADEIKSLQRAIEITDLVFDELLNELKAGAVEREVAARLSYLLKMQGAEGDSYDPIVASGWRGALPHARPSDKTFQPGDFVVLDFGALFDGYHADMTRTVCIAEATDKHREIYDTVLESHLRGIREAKAGMDTAAVDAACRDYINEKGYGDYFVHSTGHGIGLEVHTLPRLSKESTAVLQENSVVTIEPGIYLPGWGGVRIEDDVLIKKDGCIPLNRSTKQMLILD